MAGGSSVIVVEHVGKSFGPTVALHGVDLEVEEGTVLVLLGRNGAGKSTLVRILSTLLAPDAGRALIGGADVVAEAQRARSLIGLAGQAAAVDETLTARENLELVGRLYGLPRREARARAQDVLERLSLTAAADRRVFTYSGGMRRRVDLGASLVGQPKVLIMDEPTTGVDPATRHELWRFVEEFARQGTTVLLTTQYLEEADRLADQIAVLERGMIIATGTPSELKDRLGQEVLEVRTRESVDVERVRRMLAGLGSGEPLADMRWQKVSVPTSDPMTTLLAASSEIEKSGIAVEDLGLRRPTLDDVFLTLTADTASGSTPNGAGNAEPARAQSEDPPERAVRRRRSPRRLLSYAGVAALAAGLAAGVIAISQPSSRAPRQLLPRPGHPLATTGHSPPKSAASQTVTSIAGITEGRIVSLGGAPGGASADANGNIWVTLPGQGAVERVAAGSGQAQTFHTGGTPSAIAAGSDRIWVAGSSLGALASLNIFTGQPLSYTQFKRAPTAIRIDDDDSSLCTGDSNGALTHLDSTGAMLGSTGVAPSPTDVGCGEGWVWAVNDGPLGLVRMGDYGGARQFAVGAAPVAITFNGGVWLAHRDGTVNVFDPRPTQLKVTRQIAVAPSLDRIFAVENDTSVWAISKQTRTLYRISNTAQPSLTGTVVFNSPPVALTRVRQSIWVATQDGKLTEIRY